MTTRICLLALTLALAACAGAAPSHDPGESSGEAAAALATPAAPILAPVAAREFGAESPAFDLGTAPRSPLVVADAGAGEPEVDAAPPAQDAGARADAEAPAPEQPEFIEEPAAPVIHCTADEQCPPLIGCHPIARAGGLPANDGICVETAYGHPWCVWQAGFCDR